MVTYKIKPNINPLPYVTSDWMYTYLQMFKMAEV